MPAAGLFPWGRSGEHGDAGEVAAVTLANEVQQFRDYGMLLLGRGLTLAAQDEFGRWLALVEETGDPALVVPVLNALGKAASARGDVEAALGFWQRALALEPSPAMTREEKLRVWLNLMMSFTDLGRLDDALIYAGKARELEADRDPAFGLFYWLNLSVLHWRRQEWIPMRQAAGNAYDRATAGGNSVATAMALTNRGIAHLELGAHRLAERDLMGTLRLSSQLAPSELAYTHAELGRLYFMRGEYQAAMESGREALNILLTDVAMLDKEEVARVSRLFGAIFSTLGQRNLALKYLNRAAAYYSQLGLRSEWQRATESIGQVLSAPVRPARSQLLTETHLLDFLTAVLDLTDDLESVDPYLRGHSERVAIVAQLLGEASGLSEEELVTLSHAARLHDVGMIAVEADLIHKEGPLTDLERKRVALHSTIGEEMLRPYGLPQLGLEAIRHHHERWDGTGYPDGLAGEAIPLRARIIAVADVYDAITSERVYRSAMTHRQAVVELRKMAGHDLDPILVERFLALHHV
jgi:HD-GYP domain-containing protein (c-di-GMP phosphodiesterase class II)